MALFLGTLQIEHFHGWKLVWNTSENFKKNEKLLKKMPAVEKRLSLNLLFIDGAFLCTLQNYHFLCLKPNKGIEIVLR